ncbi:MAG TPA: PD-(D/E)XK nuclease family protein, partial [Methanocorpusculum sp.]|nr:PD-(D/E)XK nuclease family protein [Methanocorpusculum sp.]
PQDKYAEHSKLGTLIHGALEDFFSKTLREDLVKQPFDTLYARLLTCVHDQLESEHVIDAPSWDAKKDWYQDRVPGFEGIFRQFLEQEIAFAKEGWTTPEEMTEYKLANPDPVEIKLGEKTMKIQGSIDRIMTNGESFRIVDYKTGKSFKNDLKKGRLVQIPVYTEAYRVKNGGVPDPGYYFKLTRDECKPVPLPLKDGEDYRNVYYRVLELVFATRDRMRAGDCSRAEKCEDKYCPYKAMCRASNIAEGDDE